jgi:hypothetical protein
MEPRSFGQRQEAGPHPQPQSPRASLHLDWERVQREFDHPNNAFHGLRGKFTVGKTGV